MLLLVLLIVILIVVPVDNFYCASKIVTVVVLVFHETKMTRSQHNEFLNGCQMCNSTRDQSIAQSLKTFLFYDYEPVAVFLYFYLS